MAATEEIAIRLGVKAGDLKAALLDAGASIKKFKKDGESGPNEGLLGTLKKSRQGLEDLKSVFLGGAAAAAVKGFFALAIDAANKSTDATDSNAAAVREFAKGLDEAKGVAASFAVLSVGAFNKLGAAIGDTVNIIRSFIENGTQGFEVWARVQDAVVATGKAAEDAERRLAEVRKKNGAEFLAITKELEQIEKKMADQKLKGLTVYETERNLLIKLSGLQQELANFQGEAIDRRRLTLELAKTQLAADEASLAVRKAEADAEKKAADERAKADDDERKAFEELSERRALDRKSELELFTLQRKNAATLTADERKRLALLEAMAVQRVNAVEIETLLEKKIREGLTPAEANRLEQLSKQAQKLAEQVAQKEALATVTANVQLPAEQAVTAELEEQVRQRTMAADLAAREAQIQRSRTGTVRQVGDERTLNDTQLDDLVQKLQRQLAPIKQEDAQVGGVGIRVGTYKSIEQYLLSQNLDRALQEQALRRDFQRTQSFFGDQGAQRQFAPEDYDRLSQLFNPDIQKQQAKDLSAIAGTLRNLFPEQFSGMR